MRLTGKRLVLAFSLVGVCALSVRVATDLRRRAVAPPTGVDVTHHVDRDRLMADLRQVASVEFEGRATGTPGGLKARAWVADAFERAPLEPAGSAGFLEPFPTKDHGEGANVVGRLAGTEPGLPTIVVSAHYDHLGRKNGAIYYGADDNASGTTAIVRLLGESAYRFVSNGTPSIASDSTLSSSRSNCNGAAGVGNWEFRSMLSTLRTRACSSDTRSTSMTTSEMKNGGTVYSLR